MKICKQRIQMRENLIEDKYEPTYHAHILITLARYSLNFLFWAFFGSHIPISSTHI